MKLGKPHPPLPPHPLSLAAPSTFFSRAVGIGELLLQTTLSAFVGVFLERYLKRDAFDLSIWEVNIQLAAWSSTVYAALAIGVVPTDPFTGWSRVTVGVAAVAAAGGVLVALCLRYTDAVLKNMPVACSVVAVSAFSAAFLNGPATFPTAVGSLLVAVAIIGYVQPPQR